MGKHEKSGRKGKQWIWLHVEKKKRERAPKKVENAESWKGKWIIDFCAIFMSKMSHNW